MKAQVLTGLFVVAASLLACDDTTDPACDPCPPPAPTFKSLRTREAVINNLELSYNNRNVARFEDLLDTAFTFYLAPGDVGGSIPPQWGRTDEMAITTLLFDASLDDSRYPTCRRIRVNMDFEDGVDWIDVLPAAFPTETWYAATVSYDFTIEMKPDNTYISAAGSSARLTVRNAGTEDAPHWRLVEWWDLDAGSVLSRTTSRSSPQSSWGNIKALYR